MDSFRKHANKLRDQVAKQQQAVLKQFSTSGYGNSQGGDKVVTDEVEFQRHQNLEKLYISTRASKHFQRSLVKGVENRATSELPEVEAVTKLSQDFRKYASENPAGVSLLARVSSHCANAYVQLEKLRESLHRTLHSQVVEPLKAMAEGAALEDARNLTHQYDRLRQEAEAQVSGIGRRQARAREGGNTADNAFKLQTSELKLQELSSSMALLGKEAGAAMSAVEVQQQRLTLTRMIAMVEAEKNYHKQSSEILDEILAKIIVDRQQTDSAPPTQPKIVVVESSGDKSSSQDSISGSIHGQAIPQLLGYPSEKETFYLAEVILAFNAEAEGELTLTVGDMIVVRQMNPSGWSEGECKGKAGWFPSAYIKVRQQVPVQKLPLVYGNLRRFSES